MAAVPKQARAVPFAAVVASLAEPDRCWCRCGAATHDMVEIKTLLAVRNAEAVSLPAPVTLGCSGVKRAPRRAGGQKLFTHFCVEGWISKHFSKSNLRKGRWWELGLEQSFFLSVCGDSVEMLLAQGIAKGLFFCFCESGLFSVRLSALCTKC